MSSSALTSQGVTLWMSTSSHPLETFIVAILEIKSVDGPGGQATEIDITDLSSASKEFALGLQDEGDLNFEINYIPSDTFHGLLRQYHGDGTLKRYQLQFTDSPITKWTFSAYVKGFSISNAVDGVTNASITLRITGSITES